LKILRAVENANRFADGAGLLFNQDCDSSEHAVEEKLGHRYEKVSPLAEDPTVPRAAYVSTEAIGGAEGGLIGGLMYVGAAAAAGAIVVSGGTLAAGITAAVLAGGAGGLIGSILAKWVGDHHAHYLQEQMDRGGLLLWVGTWGAEDESRAVEILRSIREPTSTSTHCRQAAIIKVAYHLPAGSGLL
jgi:hypothetical protein